MLCYKKENDQNSRTELKAGPSRAWISDEPFRAQPAAGQKAFVSSGQPSNKKKQKMSNQDEDWELQKNLPPYITLRTKRPSY